MMRFNFMKPPLVKMSKKEPISFQANLVIFYIF